MTYEAREMTPSTNTVLVMNLKFELELSADASCISSTVSASPFDVIWKTKLDNYLEMKLQSTRENAWHRESGDFKIHSYSTLLCLASIPYKKSIQALWYRLGDEWKLHSRYWLFILHQKFNINYAHIKMTANIRW